MEGVEVRGWWKAVRRRILSGTIANPTFRAGPVSRLSFRPGTLRTWPALMRRWMGEGGLCAGFGRCRAGIRCGGSMAKKSSYFIGGLAIAAVMIGALPAAQGIGASDQRAAGPSGQSQRQGRPDGRAPHHRGEEGPDRDRARNRQKSRTERQAPHHGRLRSDVQPGDGAVDGASGRPLRRLTPITFVC